MRNDKGMSAGIFTRCEISMMFLPAEHEPWTPGVAGTGAAPALASTGPAGV
jgi:hypothetical protein